MNARTTFLATGALVAAVVATMAMPGEALAQRDAGAKIRGDYNFSSLQSGRRIEHARNYAQDLHAYLAESPKPNPVIVNELTTEMGANLEAAKSHLASMKKDAGSDTATVAAIDKIEKKLTAAVARHEKLCECCKEADFKQIEAMECCNDLAQELDQIAAEHHALMRKMSHKPLAVK